MEEQTFTIEQIRNYLLQCDSFGDALYYLSAERILDYTQKQEEIDEEDKIEHYT